MSESGGDGGNRSTTDAIRSHFITCSKCEEGAKLCPCRSRRRFLERAAGAAGLVAALGSRSLIETVSATDEEVRIDGGGGGGSADADLAMSTEEVFPQSVASGGPTESGVILWTRISGDAVTRGEHDLHVVVAETPAFDDVVHEGTVEHRDVTGNDNCVRYDTIGELDPDTEYCYRFEYGGVTSNVGHCRTLPRADQSIDELEFVVTNCNHYQNGYFHAFDYAAEHAADFMLHLGDFIYESTDGLFTSDNHEGDPRIDPPVRYLSYEFDEIEGSNGNLAYTTEDYRALYKEYKTDRSLQRALEQHTVIYTWDDHEVADDRYWDDGPAAPGDALTVERYASAIQAWLEHVPARVQMERGILRDAARQTPEDDGGVVESWYGTPLSLHDVFQLYDYKELGDLVDLLVTDQRFYRDEPPAHATPKGTFSSVETRKNQGSDFHDALKDTLDVTRDGDEDDLELETEQDGERNDPHHDDRTMLGENQRGWLDLVMDDADATWTLWMNEVLLSPLTVSEPESLKADIAQTLPWKDAPDVPILDLLPDAEGLGYLPKADNHPEAVEVYHDAWDGYIPERRDILQAADDKLDNLVALTGDMHASLASVLRAPDYSSGSDRVGVELMVPAVTSETPYEQMSEGNSFADQIPKNALMNSDDPVERLTTALTVMNNHVRRIDFRSTGYAVVRVTHDELQYKTFNVDRSFPGHKDRENEMHVVTTEGENEPSLDGGATAVATLDEQVVSPETEVTFDASDSHTGTLFEDWLYDREIEYRWSFDDGTEVTTEDSTISHTFDDPGLYDVELEFVAIRTGAPRRRGYVESTDTTRLRVVVQPENEDPIAIIEETNLDGPDEEVWPGDTVQFSAGRSRDPDGLFELEIEQIEWAFGDGSDPVTGPPSDVGTDGVTTVHHEFDEPGIYEVTMTLTDDSQVSDTGSTLVIVDDPVPDAGFSYDAPGDDPQPGDAIQFTADAPADSLRSYTYRWDFDDGETAVRDSGVTDDADQITHTFDEERRYTVTLTVESGGEAASETRTIPVGDIGEQTSESATFTGSLDTGEQWVRQYPIQDEADAVDVTLDGPTGADFDLFATNDGADPTPQDYDAAGLSVAAAEHARLEHSFQPGDEIGLMVVARRGSGAFSLTVEERVLADGGDTGSDSGSDSDSDSNSDAGSDSDSGGGDGLGDGWT